MARNETDERTSTDTIKTLQSIPPYMKSEKPLAGCETSIRNALASAHCYLEHIPSHRILYEPIHLQLTRAYQILTRMEKYVSRRSEAEMDRNKSMEAIKTHPRSLSGCVREFMLTLETACGVLKRYSLKNNGIHYLANILKPKRIRVEEVDAILYKLKKLFQQFSRWNAIESHSEECVHCSFVNVPLSRFCGYCDKELDRNRHIDSFSESSSRDIRPLHASSQPRKSDSPSNSSLSTSSYSPQEARRQLRWISQSLAQLERSTCHRVSLLHQIKAQIDSLHFEFITENGVSVMITIALSNSPEESILALRILRQIVCERDYWIEDQISVLHQLVSVALELSVRGPSGPQRAQALALVCSLMEMCEIAMFVRDTILENFGVAALLESLRLERDPHRRRQVYDILYLMASFRPGRMDLIGKDTKNIGVVDAALPDGTSSLQLLQMLRVGSTGEKLKALELLETHAAAIAYDLIVLYAGIDQLLDILRFDLEMIKEKAINVLLLLGGRDAFYRDKLLAADVFTVVLDLVTDTTSSSLFWACIDFVMSILDAPVEAPRIRSSA